jgi:hypothetical protein
LPPIPQHGSGCRRESDVGGLYFLREESRNDTLDYLGLLAYEREMTTTGKQEENVPVKPPEI